MFIQFIFIDVWRGFGNQKAGHVLNLFSWYYWQIMKKVIQKIFWNYHLPGRHTGRFTGKLINSNNLTENIWYGTFGLDEFSGKTACVTPQNSPIDDWMSFPVKRYQKFLGNLPIRVRTETGSIQFRSILPKFNIRHTNCMIPYVWVTLCVQEFRPQLFLILPDN